MTGLKQTPHIQFTTHCTNTHKYQKHPIHILHEHPRHPTNSTKRHKLLYTHTQHPSNTFHQQTRSKQRLGKNPTKRERFRNRAQQRGPSPPIHHNVLMSYRKRLHHEKSDTCPLCNISTHTIHQIMEEGPSLGPLRHSYTQPFCTEDLWDRP